MITVVELSQMRELIGEARSSGKTIGFVPTMGAIHEGHLTLVRRAREESGYVVVSIFVNPLQFGPGEDLSRYPRDLRRDLMFCRREGVDVVFVPTDSQMYPKNPPAGDHAPATSSPQPASPEEDRETIETAKFKLQNSEKRMHGWEGAAFSTYVVEERLSGRMEGASRPGHFRGVTTVVAKLFNIVQPHLAVFGAKDFQQARIVERMARDLNFPVGIIVGQTVREADGLAMSSRNKYLKGEQREEATILWKCLEHARARVGALKGRVSVSSQTLKKELRELVGRVASARLDYVELFEPDTLEPVAMAARGTHMALAVFIGGTRLIDNGRL